MKRKVFDIRVSYKGFDFITYHNAYVNYECKEYFKVYSEIKDTYDIFKKPEYAYCVEGAPVNEIPHNKQPA